MIERAVHDVDFRRWLNRAGVIVTEQTEHAS